MRMAFSTWSFSRQHTSQPFSSVHSSTRSCSSVNAVGYSTPSISYVPKNAGSSASSYGHGSAFAEFVF